MSGRAEDERLRAAAEADCQSTSTPTTHRTAPLAAEQGAEAPGGHRDDERASVRRNGEGAC